LKARELVRLNKVLLVNLCEVSEVEVKLKGPSGE